MAGINFSGIASGIDGNSIIQATLDSKGLAKIPFQNKLNTNADENKAYQKLKELLANIDSKTSIFQTYKGTAIAKSVSSGNESVMSAAVSGNAPSGTLSVKVNQLASSGRITFDNAFSTYIDPIAPGLTEAGTMNISIGTGASKKDYAIEIDSRTTLGGLVDKINTASDGKFSASLVNVGTEGTPQYKLMFSGQDTGVEKGTLNIDVSQNLQSLGIFSASTFSQAQDAIVEISGVGLLTRGSNVINDIFPGLSVEIKQVSAVPVILKISNDVDKTTAKVAEFVAAYNELKKYVDDNSRIDRVKDASGDKNVYGTLARTRVDDQLVSVLRETFRTVRSGDDIENVKVLADLGIKTNKDTGFLEFSDTEFKAALVKDPTGTGSILTKLGDKLSSTKGVIYNFTNFQGLLAQAERSNKEEDGFLSDKIERIDANLATQKAYLTKLFSKLEDTVGKLQSNATALTGLITQSSKK